jgi:DNA-binding CsgD family transcriptional regulator
MKDSIRIIESAYDLGAATEAEWLRNLTEAIVGARSASMGALAYSYNVRADGWVDVRAVCDVATPTGFAGSLLKLDLNGQDQAGLGNMHRDSGGLVSGVALLRRVLSPRTFDAYYERAFVSHGVRDFICLNATDPTRSGCVVGVPSARRERLASSRLRWDRIAAHIAAGLRLRQKLDQATKADTPLEAEAILTHDGRVEHARGPARPSAARSELRAAVLAAERARGPLRRRRPDEALEIWRGLVDGRWSLVEQFDSDGRRFLVAHSNAAIAADPRGLTARERQVAGYAALGHSNKLIAYELGLAPNTVSGLLAKAREKLGKGRRAKRD